MRTIAHFDADESIFLQRQLDHIKSQSYDVKYAELKARKLIPLSSEADPGATRIFARSYNQFGLAKLISSYADDLPRADVIGEEFSVPVRTLGSSYGYNIDEMESAAYGNVPLEQRRANAARRAIAQEENRLAFFGDADAGLPGFFTNPSVPAVVLPADGTGSSVLWANKTPDQILRDLNLVVNSIAELTLGVETADTLLMPLQAFNFINSTPRSPNSDTTILNYFLQNNPYIQQVEFVNELVDAGASSSRRMVAYRRDPEVLTMEVPKDFHQLELQNRNLEYIIPCRERFAGVFIYYPLAIAYADGF